MGLKNTQLFIRQDLVTYRKISIEEKTQNRALIWAYLQFLKMCESICIINSEKIVIQCKYDYELLKKRHIFLRSMISNKTLLHMNNVNPSWIVEKSAQQEQCAIWNKDLDKFSLAFVGDFNNPRKGQRIFVDSVRALIDDGYNVEAVLIGDGAQLEIFKEECKDYKNIRYTGRLNNPMVIIKECNLMVVPSLADSCPNTVMEALYNEIPVIGARSGGIPEILLNSDSLFNPDPSSLSEKVEYYLNEDNLLKLKKQQKLRKKELEFDWILEIIKNLEITKK